MPENTRLVVAGGLNADIICSGVEDVTDPGGDTTSEPLQVEPGGKGHNIAVMASELLKRGEVAMCGRVSRDPHDLWKLPVDSLEEHGVSTRYVRKEDYEETGEYPGVALVVVDREGDNLINMAAGANYSFSPRDIEDAEPVFRKAAESNGLVAMSFDIPLETLEEAASTASRHGLDIVMDPGAAKADRDYTELLEHDILLLKPNMDEAERLTGVEVNGFESAGKAADKLLEHGVRNVLITAGPEGAYLFSEEKSGHITLPDIQGTAMDETGCGDQVMAAFCASFLEGRNVEQAAEKAVKAGTLQFYREGVQPVEPSELE